MEIRDVANPIGEVQADEAIDNYIKVLHAEWEELKETSPWWQFWGRPCTTPEPRTSLKQKARWICRYPSSWSLTGLRPSDRKGQNRTGAFEWRPPC